MKNKNDFNLQNTIWRLMLSRFWENVYFTWLQFGAIPSLRSFDMSVKVPRKPGPMIIIWKYS